MMSNNNIGPRSSWLLITGWLISALIIPGLSAFGRPLQHWVFRNIGEDVLAAVIGLALFGLGIAASYQQGRRGAVVPGLLLKAFALIAIIAIISFALPQTEERLHFVTFGLFGFFSKRLFPVWLAILAIVIFSTGDELFQAWLPDRVGDLRDVGINIIAGIIGFGFAWRGPG